MSNLELSEQEIIRRKSLQELRNLGINPYPAEEFKTTHFSTDIKEQFNENEEVVIAGRIMSRRIMGKASFAELQDSKGRIQIYINRDEICPGEDKTLYNTVFKKLLDIGDFIGIKGFVFKTQMGEITVHAKELTVLSKSLRPLPIVKEKDGKVYDAFSDPEMRYRQRYVDLVVNPEVRETFRKRTLLVQTIRNFFNSYGYLEVDTPVLQPIPGGAAASPFVTHHNALNIPLYLRIANELYLKRLIVGGYEGVYEFSRNFRNEGMDRTHNPEFTALEIYQAYTDIADGAYKREKSAGKAGNWRYAEKYCRRLNYAGYRDWRLPTADELMHIHRKYGQVFNHFRGRDFWTSTPASKGKYYVVYPADAYRYEHKIKRSNYIRCVRCMPEER